MTSDGNIEKYLGVDIKALPNSSKGNKRFAMAQPHLIERILSVVNVDDTWNRRTVPAIKPILHRDANGPERKYSWNYRQAIGMMNYLLMCTRPELAMSVHQCARFCNDPKLQHERALLYIARYLLNSKDQGIIYEVDKTKGLECYVDADFAGGFTKETADNPENVMSRTGDTIMFAGCPIIWCSKLQTEIGLATAEAEYIALSQALRDVIPLINVLNELQDYLGDTMKKPIIRCKVYEDNESCIKMAESEKFTPRTKHIALKYHWFRKHVQDGLIQINHINTHDQIADIFTKPLEEAAFTKLRKLLSGW